MDGIGKRIRYLRETKELSMNELEDLLGASRGSVNKWEKGSIPGGKYLVSLSDFFEVSTDWILKGKEHVSNEQIANSPPEDLELLAKFHRLTERQKGKIEGHIEEMLGDMLGGTQGKISSNSISGSGREEAATRQNAG